MSKASIWEIVVAELSRLESQGKDDHRDSWMGNAIKAVNRLEEHCRKHNAYPELEPRPEGTSTAENLVRAETLLRRIADAGVIFPSMCANNMEAMTIVDDLKPYRSKPQPSVP